MVQMEQWRLETQRRIENGGFGEIKAKESKKNHCGCGELHDGTDGAMYAQTRETEENQSWWIWCLMMVEAVLDKSGAESKTKKGGQIQSCFGEQHDGTDQAMET